MKAAVDGRPGPTVRLGPVECDASAVPAQQRVRSDQPSRGSSAGVVRPGLAEQCAVGLGQRGPVDLAPEHGQQVAQHDDLESMSRPEPTSNVASVASIRYSAVHQAPKRRSKAVNTTLPRFRHPHVQVRCSARPGALDMARRKARLIATLVDPMAHPLAHAISAMD